jgi:hypothetical protein
MLCFVCRHSLNVKNAVSGVPMQPAGSLNCGMHALIHLEGFLEEICCKDNATVTTNSLHLPEGFWRTTGRDMTSEAAANQLRYEMFSSLYKQLRPVVKASDSSYKQIVLHHLDRMRATFPLAPVSPHVRPCRQLGTYPLSLFNCTL